MSARPRPVTATFKPRSMAPPTGVRTRSYSLSSGSSTESLVSVLDHDSYESLGDESEPDSRPSGKVVSQVQNITQTYETESFSAVEQKPLGIEAWEKWMVEKAIVIRKQQRRESCKLKREKEVELRAQNEKQEKLKSGEEKVKDWIERKNLADKLHKKVNIRQEKVKNEVNEQKKQQIMEKSDRKYQDWIDEKKNKEKEQKRLAKEEKRKKAMEKEDRQKKCQEAFDSWSKDAQKRPKSAHSSLGYTSGKLTGYHDTCTYPVPRFVNPIPWHPVEIPRQKTTRTRPKSTKKWNPDKYF